MRSITRPLLAGAIAMLATSAAWAQIDVSYDKPEQYTDMPFMQVDREQILKELSAHFTRLGSKLPPGQTLKIEVLDLDLAGRLYPRRNGDDIRVMRGGADWPRMHLRYTLEQDGKVLRSGDEELSNMAYQDRINRYSDSDDLRYEKQMLDDWFNKQFLPPRQHG
ncbi:DUF3016 domain-containing protein [Rugamonas sp.]|uniref:DUF3016 domain-containing protein n=1 Tax=Rugamonas sp. TaxID=1926287 RepID=UPI0025D2B76A|nr:DUF3016 domain-containing protein [Rugamonas sp.]